MSHTLLYQVPHRCSDEGLYRQGRVPSQMPAVLLASLTAQSGVTAQAHSTSLQLGRRSPLPLTTALSLLLQRATTASSMAAMGKLEVAEVHDTLPRNVGLQNTMVL